MKKEKSIGIYIHIPFCRSKCAYCDFYSFVPGKGPVTAEYTEALSAHIRRAGEKFGERTVDTVFIGGGTPTFLGAGALAAISEQLFRSFHVSENAEFTVEANPATVSRRDLEILSSAGVNRLSIGLQSANAGELRSLSRTHSYRDFLEAYESARAVGIGNINVDLMYGIPDQTEESFGNTLRTVTELRPEHLSLYSLMIEEGTPLYRRRDRLALPDEDAEFAMYSGAAEFLSGLGYRHYEISNYSLPGFECRHNLRYWQSGEYLGFGPAAHSYVDGVRYSYAPDVAEYIRGVGDGTLMPDSSEKISDKEAVAEYVMLRFRLADGISTGDFAVRFGCGFTEAFGPALEKYIRMGKMLFDGERYFLTEEGMYVSNTILSDIIEFDIA